MLICQHQLTMDVYMCSTAILKQHVTLTLVSLVSIHIGSMFTQLFISSFVSLCLFLNIYISSRKYFINYFLIFIMTKHIVYAPKFAWQVDKLSYST